ncbi:MAG TPA: adenylate/guanylate cyclase domain-containing protein, partial [Terriglobales bacterium]|nr:adenylate/guanylate cyclase domain-containing protein [Terriglobales bacterium]
ERFERRRVLAAFGRYLSKDLMDEVLRDASALRGARREVSILFADLRNFTSIAETTAPEAIARQMSDYFDAMGAVIGKHRGMVNDFVGDGIMAVFNAPVNDPDHARHAVECALAMQVTLEQLNGRWAAVARPPLSAGVAVHTGMVFAGNVGGRTRTKYAVVGDVVNVASRVENLNKELGTAILITDATRAALAVPMPTRNVGSLVVRGRQAPVTVYEVLAPAVPGVPVEVTA